MGASRNDAEQIKVNLVTGANASTDIALTGIVANDAVINIINLTDLAEVSLAGLVVKAGAVNITASTSAKKLLIVWRDRSAG